MSESVQDILTPCPDNVPTRILIADDDHAFRDSLTRILVNWGYQVQNAPDGGRAWDMILSGPPDLALLDWTMPGFNGLELCRKVRALDGQNHTYVILLSGHAATEDTVAGLEAGADDYITKPVDFLSFQARVKVGVRMVKLQQQLAQRARTLERSLAEVKQLELEAAEARQREHFLAFHDSLTGLPNRQLFNDRLQQTIAAAQRGRQSVAVLFLDLNGYKTINDSIGHAAGDLLLQMVSQRLKSCMRESDTVARLGGDEFAVIASSLSKGADAEAIANRILQCLTEPFSVDGQACQIGASIGISVYPTDASDVESIIKRADLAMYRAKRQDKNGYALYAGALNSGTKDCVQIENDLREALIRNEFVLHYQPQANLTAAELTGVEALLRWQRPRDGLLVPEEFLSVAEETGLIVPIGKWVLLAACRQAALELPAHSPKLRVAVNLSAREFRGAQLASTVAEVLRETGLEPEYLELEISESVAMQNLEHSLEILTRLKDMGVRLALDDFGAGFSSLGSLKRFPIDLLKIDRSFVQGLPDDQESVVITRAIVSMAHRLQLTVLAEGVETAAQWQFLRSIGCDEAQGYLLGTPIPFEEMKGNFDRRFSPHVSAANN